MTEPAAVSDDRPPRRLTPFLPTRQHRRFVEFADAVRRHRYIGACYGAPGIGKTLSARTYAAADDYDRWATDRFMRSAVLPPALLASRTQTLTPGFTTTLREFELQLLNRCLSLNADIARTLCPDVNLELSREPVLGLELLIIDEADRLKTAALEMVRDYFDTGDVGIVLIGMPGFERRLARYPQLYSRVGFAHQYRPLDSTDIPQVLAQYWQELGLTYDPHRHADAESVVAIVRITGGNFRLVERLMSQAPRIMATNTPDPTPPDAIEAPREVLVVGACPAT